MITFVFVLLLSLCRADQVLVPGGVFKPLFADQGEKTVRIKPLWVDKTPVTNEQYLKFVQADPRWSSASIPPIRAEDTYLKQWTAPTAFPSSIGRFPVIHVSWFAARAYCESVGGRLPTINEWEYFSDAGNSEQEARTLEWYAKGQSQLHAVGEGKPNKFGLYDTSGLVWEWVDDFSAAILAGDSRQGPMRDMFCGGAALKTKDPKRYAAFIRYALRASLKARYTTSTLGFRCVKEKK